MLAPAAVSGILLLLLQWTTLMLGGFLGTGRCSGSVCMGNLCLSGLRCVSTRSVSCVLWSARQRAGDHGCFLAGCTQNMILPGDICQLLSPG